MHMISFQQFIEQAKRSRPPLLTNYLPRIRFSALQVIGACVLLCYTGGILFFLNACIQDSSLLDQETKELIFFFLLFCVLGWIGLFYSLKQSSKEHRKIYPISRSVRIYDTGVLIVGLILWVLIFGRENPLQEMDTFLSMIVLFSLSAYFLCPWRSKKAYQGTPLIRLFSILGIKATIADKNPFQSVKCYSDISVPVSFSLAINGQNIIFARVKTFGLTYKSFHENGQDIIFTGVKTIDYAKYHNAHKYMIFSIPYSQKRNLDKIIQILKQFLDTTTGQSLTFHTPVIRCIHEQVNDRIEILFVLQSRFFNTPDFYENQYFYYDETAACQLYNDISKLYHNLENCFNNEIHTSNRQ